MLVYFTHFIIVIPTICSAWDEGRQRPRCSPVQVFNSGIRALTTDETGAVWAGSAKGEVKCLRLEGLHQDGAVLGTELRVLGSLQHTGSGNPELSAANPIGRLKILDLFPLFLA